MVFSVFQPLNVKKTLPEERLANYVTYKMRYQIASNTPENPDVPTSKAIKTIKRY
jgi:hypothetical protein